MANEFKIKKGLIVTGASGGTVVDIQGSQGQLFSVTDDLTGTIFTVSDISGVPILTINSSGLSTFDGLVSGITPVNAANFVTKAYADGLTPGAGVFLPLAGGTMTGNITLPGEENNTFKIGFTGATATSGLSTVDQSGAGLYIGANSKLNNSGVVVYNNSALPSSGIYFDGWNGDDMEFYTGASGNPTKRLTISSTGNASFEGNVDLGDSSNITMAVGAPGQLQVKGSGYTGAVALDATAMYIYHDSALRDLVLGTNETARLTISGNSGNTVITGVVTAPTFSGDLNGTINTATTGVTQVNAIDNTTIATTAYVNNKIAELPAGLIFLGTWNADTNTPTLASGGGERSEGTTTTLTANKLIDSAATFTTAPAVVAGDRVRVVTPGGPEFALVTSVDSATQLTLAADIVTATGEAYILEVSPFIPEGNYYIVSTDGDTDLNGIDVWSTGDWVVASSTNVWQKIINSSVLDGTGTGNQSAKWAGSGTSNTLTNGSIEDEGTILNAIRINSTTTTTKNYIGMGMDSTNNQRLSLAEADSNGSHIRMVNSRSGGGYFVVGVGDTNSSSNIVPPGGMFFYNGATRMVINSSGNVGIGTTLPSTTLQLSKANTEVLANNPAWPAGILEITDTSTYNAGTGATIVFRKKRDSTGNQVTVGAIAGEGVAGASRLSFWTGDSAYMGTAPKMVINNLGNVGIGTISPSAKLSVDGVASMGLNSRLSMGILDINSSATPTQILIQTTIPFNSGSADFTVNIKGFVYGTDESCNLSIHWHYYNSVPYNANITSSGSWAPIANLHSSSSGFIQIHLLSPGYWPKIYVESMYSSAYNDLYASGWSWSDAAGTGTAYALDYNKDFGNNFVMTDPGNVGIGTSGPSAKLHVDSSTAFSLTSVAGDTLFLSDDTNPSALNGVGASIGFSGPQEVQRQAAIAALRTGADHDHIGLAFYTHPGTSNDETIVEQMRITDSGNVGIGTDSPGTFLQIGDYPSNNIDITTYPDVPSEHMIHLTAPETTNRYGGGISFGENAFTAANITVQDAGGGGSLNMLFGTRHTSGIVQERMRITSTGHLQVSTGYFELTSQPTTKLWLSTNQVQLYAGNLLVFGGYNASNDSVVIGNESGDVNVTLAGGANNKVLYLEGSSGNVGIGTKTPDNILHIETAAAGGPQIQLESTSGTAAAAFINFDSTNLQLSTQRDMVDGTWYDTAKSWGGINIQGPAGGSFITFQTAAASNTSPSERFRIASDGKIQVGSDKVIWAGGYGGALVIRQNNATNDRLIKMVTVDSTGAIAYDNVLVVKGNQVGIGTDSPSTTLSVKGTSGNGINVIGVGTTATRCYLGLNSANKGYLFIAGSSGENPAVITSQGDSYISTDLSVGKTSPDFKLDVEGTFGVSDLPGNGSSTSVLVQDQTTTPLTVVNGDFATDTGWSKDAGWTISGGKANVSGAQTGTTYIYQGGILPNPPENIEYIIKYTISNYSAGAFQINVGGYISSSPAQAANGTYEVKVTPTNTNSNTNIYIQANSAAIGSVDRISVKQVTAGTNQIKARELGGGIFDDTWAVTPTDSNNIYNLNSGNVGIGTSTPLAKLDIQGTQGQLFSVTDNLSGSIFAVSDISGVPIFDVNSSGLSTFDGNINVNAQILTPGGSNLGLNPNTGLVTVGGTLQTSSNVRVLGQSLFLSNSSVFNKITLNGTDMEIWSGALFPSIDITNTGLLKFGAYALSGAGTPTKLLGVDNSGNVLTTVSGSDLPGGPYLPLSAGSGERVTGNLYISEAIFMRPSSTYGSGYRVMTATGTNSAPYTSTISFSNYAQNDVMVIQGSNVGIGDTSPSNKLDVNGDVRATEYKFRGNFSTDPTTTAISIYDRATVGLTLSAHSTSFRAWNGSAMIEAGRLAYDKLTVVGDVIAYGTPSDKRLKENVKPIDSALDKAMKLQGVTFDWKESDSILNIKEDIGFIAQDVQKVLPELVRENKDGMLSMRHQGIAPILLEAIKELKAEIDLLKSKPCTCNNCNCNI